jgi:phosphohistidine phosphatase
VAASRLVEPQLLLLRHGIAEERRPDRDDEARALTARGRRRSRAVLRRARDLGLSAGRMVSSPLVRALQTAEIALAVSLADRLETDPGLAPGADPLPLLRRWLEPAGQEPPPGRLLLVGHEPDLGHLAARLIGAPPGSIALRKAGLALLSFPGRPDPEGRLAGVADLRLLLSPRVLLR